MLYNVIFYNKIWYISQITTLFSSSARKGHLTARNGNNIMFRKDFLWLENLARSISSVLSFNTHCCHETQTTTLKACWKRWWTSLPIWLANMTPPPSALWMEETLILIPALDYGNDICWRLCTLVYGVLNCQTGEVAGGSICSKANALLPPSPYTWKTW